VASRLAAARKRLANRLTRRGLGLSAGGLALVFAEETASAVPPALTTSTVRLAAGRALSSTSVAALVKGVLMTMLLKKLKLFSCVMLVVVGLGAGGGVFRLLGGAEARADDGQKPRSELEALRHENELLRLNLNVVLEKVHAQEAELRSLKKGDGSVRIWAPDQANRADTVLVTPDGAHRLDGVQVYRQQEAKMSVPVVGGAPAAAAAILSTGPQPSRPDVAIRLWDQSAAPKAVTILSDGKVHATGDAVLAPATGDLIIFYQPLASAEAALHRLRDAKDEDARRKAIHELEGALKAMKAQKAPTPTVAPDKP
jgi:hypothetical protein